MDVTLGDFVKTREAEGIGVKSAVIEYAALERGMTIDRYTPNTLVAHRKGVSLPFRNMNGAFSSATTRYLCDAKNHSRQYLREAGLSVTPSKAFHETEYDQAWEYAQSLSSQVVVKPNSLSRGRGISTNVQTEDQFRKAWELAVQAYGNLRRDHTLLVEGQVEGNDYRLFAISGGTEPIVLATLRRRARVNGDGNSTLRQLIKRKNKKRARNPYLAGFPIPDTLEMLEEVTAAGLCLDHVPESGERFTLRRVSNLSAGGDSVDYTDRIHPGYRDIALKAVEAIPGLCYAGVDIIAPSIRSAPSVSNHVVSEVEYSPAPITHFPWYGEPQDMGGAIIDFYLNQFTPQRPRSKRLWKGLLRR